jgi:hypothetical protein
MQSVHMQGTSQSMQPWNTPPWNNINSMWFLKHKKLSKVYFYVCCWGSRPLIDYDNFKTHFDLFKFKRNPKKCWSDSTNLDTIDYNQVLKVIRDAINTTTIATLTLGSRLNVECKGTWGQMNVFRSETHVHTWGKV